MTVIETDTAQSVTVVFDPPLQLTVFRYLSHYKMDISSMDPAIGTSVPRHINFPYLPLLKRSIHGLRSLDGP